MATKSPSAVASRPVTPITRAALQQRHADELAEIAVIRAAVKAMGAQLAALHVKIGERDGFWIGTLEESAAALNGCGGVADLLDMAADALTRPEFWTE